MTAMLGVALNLNFGPLPCWAMGAVVTCRESWHDIWHGVRSAIVRLWHLADQLDGRSLGQN
jgi:hypothetical protein